MKKHLLIIMAILGLAATASAQVRLPEKPKRASGHTDYQVEESGYWIGAFLDGYFASNGRSMAGAAQFNIVNGYRFSEFLKVGIGVAPRYYFKANADFCGQNGQPFSVPIYADVRGNINAQYDAMFAFCWSADLGYTINEGVYASPFIGIRVGDIRHDFTVGFSYAFQGHKVADEDRPIHLVGLRIGYEF